VLDEEAGKTGTLEAPRSSAVEVLWTDVETTGEAGASSMLAMRLIVEAVGVNMEVDKNVEAVGVIIEARGVNTEARGVNVEAVGVIIEAVGENTEAEGEGARLSSTSSSWSEMTAPKASSSIVLISMGLSTIAMLRAEVEISGMMLALALSSSSSL
jgi:hypothetical protein